MFRGVLSAAVLLLTGCAGPFNQVTPCVINCAVTLTGNPATAPVPVAVIPQQVEVTRRP